MASVRYARYLAELFSDDHVFFLSRDDKIRVLVRLPVSRKQDLMLMHLEYEVSLPDHDFPVRKHHKLIPSVYASCKLSSVTMDLFTLQYGVANMVKALLRIHHENF